MPNTKITKDRLKNHWEYSKKVYIFMTIVAVALASIIFTVATNRNPPDEQMVGVALVASVANITPIENDIARMEKNAQQYDPSLKKVTFMNIQYSGGEIESEMDYYGAQIYSVQLATTDYDIFIQNKTLTDQLFESDVLFPIDTLPSFELFETKYPDALIWEERQIVHDEDDEDEDAPPTVTNEKHVYYVSVSSLMGLIEKSVFDVRDNYACILRRSANPDTSLYVLYQMFELYNVQPTE